MITVVPRSRFGAIKIAVAIDTGDGWYWVGSDPKYKHDAPEGFMPEPHGWSVVDERDNEDAEQIRKEEKRALAKELRNLANYAKERGETAKVQAIEEVLERWKQQDEET